MTTDTPATDPPGSATFGAYRAGFRDGYDESRRHAREAAKEDE